jgi:hypothetical protein
MARLVVGIRRRIQARIEEYGGVDEPPTTTPPGGGVTPK